MKKLNTFLNKLNIYHYMILFLIILNITSALFYGFGFNALIPTLIAVLTTSILDLIIQHFKTKKFVFSFSAIISGLFIGGILAQNLNWYIYVMAGIIAILSKHIIRIQQRHIFNPANFGVLLVSIIFGANHTWWVASPLVLMILFGIFIIWKLKRFDLVTTFLSTYLLPYIIINFNIIKNFNELYLLIVNSGIILFFSMFMLIEPKTTPTGKRQRVIYGILVGVLLIVFGKLIPQHDLPLALAVGNVIGVVLNKIKF